MKLTISPIASLSATAAELSWYIYKGNPFTLTGGTAKVKVVEGMRIGIRPVARSKDYYIVTEESPKKLFKITQRKAANIAATGKHIKRVVLPGEQPTEKTREVLNDAATQKFDSDRYKPLTAVRNEAFARDGGTEAFGADTTNYQWRMVRDPEFIIQTNKTTIKLRRGDKIGMRFNRPSQGGKILGLNGMYETVNTAEYDRLAADLPLIPKNRWPQTVVTPEMIQEYQLSKDKQRRQASREVEKERAAQARAERDTARAEKQKREDEEKQRRVLDAKENNEINRKVAEVAKAEAERKQRVAEERKANAGLKDEDLRNVKAGTMKPIDEVMEEEDVEDDEDFGEDLEGEVERTSDIKRKERVEEAGKATLDKEAIKAASNLSTRLADAYKEILKTAKGDKEAAAAIRGEYVAALKRMKTEGEPVVEEWEKRAAETSSGEPEAPTGKVKPKAAPAAEPEEEQEEEFEEPEAEEEEQEDPEAEEKDPDAEAGAEDPDAEAGAEDPDAEGEGEGEAEGEAEGEGEAEEQEDPDAEAEEEDPDAEAEEEDPDAEAEEQEEDFDEDAAGDEAFEEEEDPDAEVEDPEAEEEEEDFDEDAFADEDPDAEEEDPDAEEEDPDAEEEQEEDFEPTADEDLEVDDLEDPTLDEDSSGIADSLRNNVNNTDFDHDDSVDDLADVDEEEIGNEEVPEEEDVKPIPRKDAEGKKGKDEEAKKGKEESEEDPLDVEEADEDAAKDMPKPAGIKDTREADIGDLLVFHDDKKMKRRFLLLKTNPSEKNDRITEHTLWDFDNKPETYRVVRINEARQQNILKIADKVGQVTPKEFSEAQSAADNLELDKSAIKS